MSNENQPRFVKTLIDNKKKNDGFLPQNDSVEKIGWDDIIISNSLKTELISVVKFWAFLL